MEKKNAFSVIEVFISSSLFLSTVLIFIPIVSNLQIEKQVLSDRRMISILLQEELQQYIWEEEPLLPTEETIKINEKMLQFKFSKENDLIKGCVYWQNAKEMDETLCFHGLPSS